MTGIKIARQAGKTAVGASSPTAPQCGRPSLDGARQLDHLFDKPVARLYFNHPIE
jgi:hypothetical protein